MYENLKPTGNLVLVERDKTEVRTEGGLFLPDNRAEQPLFVTVLAVGPGEMKNGVRMPMNVKVGDRCVLRQWCGAKLEPHKGWDSIALVHEPLIEAILESVEDEQDQ